MRRWATRLLSCYKRRHSSSYTQGALHRMDDNGSSRKRLKWGSEGETKRCEEDKGNELLNYLLTPPSDTKEEVPRTERKKAARYVPPPPCTRLDAVLHFTVAAKARHSPQFVLYMWAQNRTRTQVRFVPLSLCVVCSHHVFGLGW